MRVPVATECAHMRAPSSHPRDAVNLRLSDDSRDGTGRKNMQQLILLRWIAVVGQVLTIGVVHAAMGIALPLQPMLAILVGLVLFNIASLLHWRRGRHVGDAALLLALGVDIASLTAQLYLSGGISNPFVFLFLLQVALGAVLLRPLSSWIVVSVTAACVVFLAHVPGPVAIPVHLEDGLADPHVLGLLVCFGLVATLLVVFITRIGRIVRARDARLATMRQQAAEEEHIVRMGLLASGAAHELGTPLSTLAVILRDWRDMPAFRSDPELLQDVIEMETQITRCKAIVTGILLSAGETRGEAPAPTTLHRFFEELVAEWRATRPAVRFDYLPRLCDDVPIVSDTGLKQMIDNILDNALEASPNWLALDVVRGIDSVTVRVTDAGPGFPPAMLERLGQPYHSSKGRPGGGLGLFLSLNVARTLGGTLAARNRDVGGAEVTVTLPLSAVLLDREDDTHDAD